MKEKNSISFLIFLFPILIIILVYYKISYNNDIRESNILYSKGKRCKAFVYDTDFGRYRTERYFYIFLYNDSLYYSQFGRTNSKLDINIGDSIDIYFLESNPRISQSAIDIYENLKLKISEK